MPNNKQKTGFCLSCVSNVPHYYRRKSLILHLINVLTLGIPFAILRVGPWYCRKCGEKCLMLPYRSRRASNYISTAQVLGRMEELEPTAESWDDPTELRHSSVNGHHSIGRFSDHYRDAIVSRILSRTATFEELERDLSVTKAELLMWIADKVERLHRENASLRMSLSRTQTLTVGQQFDENHESSSKPNGEVSRRIRPR